MKQITKNFLRHLKSNPLFAGEYFETREDVFGHFRKPEDSDIILCYASYDIDGYDGYATVIYYRKSTRKYYEAYGSHCSCYGLEDQWTEDEEVNFKELENRLMNGNFKDGNIFKNAFMKFKGSGN